jgi:fructan beta-fructosidase
MNFVKRYTAVLGSLLLFLLFAAVGTARAGDGANSKEITVSKTYLLMPISNAAKRDQTISLVVDGKEVRHVKAGLAEKKEDVDWWAFFDISAYKGQTLSVSLQPINAGTFDLITQSDKVPGEDTWGSEPKRPQFHFSQMVGWNNDPNGMVYYQGEWHLYFQLNPVALPWGNMTWGHAVSKDLVSWKQLPNVFHHKPGDAMYSGGAVVDWKNTGGWKTGENDVIVAAWTSTGRGECIAYSNDKGRTFTE